MAEYDTPTGLITRAIPRPSGDRRTAKKREREREKRRRRREAEREGEKRDETRAASEESVNFYIISDCKRWRKDRREGGRGGEGGRELN